MDLIKNFFDRFANFTPPDDAVKRLFGELIKREFDIDLERKDITVRNQVLYIKAPAAFKSELFMRKAKLLTSLREQLGKGTPIDIR